MVMQLEGPNHWGYEVGLTQLSCFNCAEENQKKSNEIEHVYSKLEGLHLHVYFKID